MLSQSESAIQKTLALGFDRAEIYSEIELKSNLKMTQNYQTSQIFLSGGTALRCHNAKGMHFVSQDGYDLPNLFPVLEGKRFTRTQTHPLPKEFRLLKEEFLSGYSKVCEKINRFSRRFIQTQDQVEGLSIEFDWARKFFNVAHSSNSPAFGQLHMANVKLTWLYGNLAWPVHTFIYHSPSIERLIADLEETQLLRKTIQNSIQFESAWPAPSGEIPVVWSPTALSKVLSHFMSGFEGDLVLQNKSFLTKVSLPISLPFQIVDRPQVDFHKTDMEGTVRKETVLFQLGRPRALAVDLETAAQMSVQSTGHCRRESYKSPPTIGIWRPEIKAEKTVESVLDQVKGGLYIGDTDIQVFDLVTGEAHLCLKNLKLIHQGEIGEPVENVKLRTNLLTLLQSLDLFSESAQSVTLKSQKNSQQLVTEWICPESLSLPIIIPGTVPRNQYW